MNGFENWKLLVALLLGSTSLAVLIYRAFNKNKTGEIEIYGQIACGLGGAALGIFGAVMLADAYHLQGWQRLFCVLFWAVVFGVGLQKAILGSERRGPIDFG